MDRWRRGTLIHIVNRMLVTPCGTSNDRAARDLPAIVAGRVVERSARPTLRTIIDGTGGFQHVQIL